MCQTSLTLFLRSCLLESWIKVTLKYMGAEVRVEGMPTRKQTKDLVHRCEALSNFPHLHNWRKLSFCRMCFTALLPYLTQTDFNFIVCQSSDLEQAVRAMNLHLQSVFGLAGVHKSFIHGSKARDFSFPLPRWIIGSNALVTPGYSCKQNHKIPRFRDWMMQIKVYLDELIKDTSNYLISSITPRGPLIVPYWTLSSSAIHSKRKQNILCKLFSMNIYRHGPHRLVKLPKQTFFSAKKMVKRWARIAGLDEDFGDSKANCIMSLVEVKLFQNEATDKIQTDYNKTANVFLLQGLAIKSQINCCRNVWILMLCE